MWDEGERMDLKDLTMSLVPDEGAEMNKSKRHLKWDQKKKRYV